MTEFEMRLTSTLRCLVSSWHGSLQNNKENFTSMFIFLLPTIYLFIYLAIYLFTYLFIYLPFYLFTYLFIYLFIYLSNY